MAGERTLARRYARALLAWTEGADDATRRQDELYAVASLWSQSHELRTLIGSPRTTRAEKRALLDKLFAERLDPRTLHFLYLLVDKGRFALIGRIAESYDALNDELRGVCKARVRTFLPLTDAQREQLLERLRAFTSRPTIELQERVDPELLGGIVVEIGAYLLDGSIRGRLRKLRDRLLLGEQERAQQAAALGARAVARAG